MSTNAPPSDSFHIDSDDEEAHEGPVAQDKEHSLETSLDPPEEDEALPPRGPLRRLRHVRTRRKRERNRVYQDEDDELHELYRELGVLPPARREAYTHPMIHMLRGKRCIIGSVTIVSLFLAILIVGVLVHKKDPNETLGQVAMKILTDEEDKLHSKLHSSQNSEANESETSSDTHKESEDYYQRVTESYKPTWHDRGDGWEGQSYDEGILFCAGLGRILCPYEG